MGKKQPISIGLPFRDSDEVSSSIHPHTEETRGDKDSEGQKQTADMEPHKQTHDQTSGPRAEYHTDETQSVGLRYKSLTKNKGKPSFEGELDVPPKLFTSATEIKSFLLSDEEDEAESEEEMLGAGDEHDDEVTVDTALSQSPPQSPKDKEPEPSQSSKPIDAETLSSSVGVLLKYNRTDLVTERCLIKYLCRVSQVLHDRLVTDSHDQHKQVADTMASLKADLAAYNTDI